MGKRGRRSGGEDHWRAVMKRFAEAGQSVSAFCQGESIAPQTFYYWRARLRGAAARAGRPAQSDSSSPRAALPGSARGFIELGTLAAPGALDIRLDLGAGVVLQIRRG